MRRVQKEVYSLHEYIGLREKEIQLSEMQVQESQTADQFLSDRYVQKKLKKAFLKKSRTTLWPAFTLS